MAYHCLYSTDIPLAGVVGVGGYMFGVTPFWKGKPTPKRHIHGLNDKTREWAHVKVCFEGKFAPEEIVLLEGMGHEASRTKTKAEMAKFLSDRLKNLELRSKL